MLTAERMEGQIREVLNQYSDDVNVPSELIFDLIVNSANNAIKNELNKRKPLSDTYIMTLPCEELELVSDTLCCSLGFEPNCKLLRTKRTLPEVLTYNGGKAIMSVGPATITDEWYNYSNYNRIQYVGNTPVSSQLIYAFDLDGKMYIFSKGNKKYLLTQHIMIRIIPSNPMDLINYLTCSGKPCFSASSPYPMDLWMWQTLVKPHVINELSIKLSIPRDTDNNAKDDTENSGTKSPKLPQPKEE